MTLGIRHYSRSLSIRSAWVDIDINHCFKIFTYVFVEFNTLLFYNVS